jgi:Uma2 family endonuclease
MSRDLGDKLRAYRRNGVREYIVWRVEDGAIDWFQLVEGEYEAMPPNARGMMESAAFPGLRLDVPALLALDAAKVLAALD